MVTTYEVSRSCDGAEDNEQGSDEPASRFRSTMLKEPPSAMFVGECNSALVRRFGWRKTMLKLRDTLSHKQKNAALHLLVRAAGESAASQHVCRI